ncbi:MAG TPA: MotA/TolQ/ExbB proton channel family protein [Emcibacteraceae bacterium]|nr:MotA/TolQ/ExbB proton channel family protein [Emcibacteraceae bacterium]
MMNIAYIFEHGDPVLIATFMLLIVMSVASWYVIFSKIQMIRTENGQLISFKEQYATSPDWPTKLTGSEYKGKGSISRLLNEANRLKPQLKDKIPEQRQQLLTLHLSQNLDEIRVRLDEGLTILASIGSSAPFIGLFGTVWGIYGTLTDISSMGNASLNVIAGPMGEALIATAVGLYTAIPAYIAYNYFVRRNRVLVQQLRHICEQLSLYLDRGE